MVTKLNRRTKRFPLLYVNYLRKTFGFMIKENAVMALECRFYPLSEIREITNKSRSRDIQNLLTRWRYKFEWINRRGVTILSKPETPLEHFESMARQIVGINTQIDCEPFAWFVMLLIEDDEFSSMPWEIRSVVLRRESGFEVTERTLRSWASYLCRGKVQFTRDYTG